MMDPELFEAGEDEPSPDDKDSGQYDEMIMLSSSPPGFGHSARRGSGAHHGNRSVPEEDPRL